MAVMVVVGCVLAVIAVGVGSMVLFPVFSHLESSDIYLSLLPKYQSNVDKILVLTAATPAVLVGVIFVWAYMRGSRHDKS